MTFTYTAPDANDKDAIRFLVGDTDVTDPQLQDEEISWALSIWQPVWGTLQYVASVLAENIAAKYTREANLSADGVSVGLGAVAQQYRDLAQSLREQHNSLLVGGFPDVGGVSPGEGLAWNVKPFTFGKGMDDNVEAGQQDFGGEVELFYPVEEFPG